MAEWSATLDRLLEPLRYLSQPGERIYWFYLLTALAFAVLVYAKTRDRAEAFSLRACLGYLFPRAVYAHQGTATDALFFFVNRVLWVLAFAPLVLSASAVAAWTTRGLRATLGDLSRYLEPGWGLQLGVTLFLVLAIDFGVFFGHWLFHRVPLLWEFHKTHHSAEVMTPITTYRLHPVDDLITMSSAALCGGVALGGVNAFVQTEVDMLSLLGVNAFTFAFYVLGYNLRHSHVWLHFGPAFSWLLISPAQHQIHHSRAPQHYDKNMGFMFSFWDRAFGTLYVPRERETIEFGLGDGTEPEYRTVRGLYLVPFRNSFRMIVAAATGGPVRKFVSLCLVLGMLGTLVYDVFLHPTSGAEAPQSVKLEELTWPEVRERVAAGSTTVLVPTGGTEQNGPHVVLGKHNYVVGHTSVAIAEALGDALVAPTLSYVPEGEVDPPSGHMHFPGTLSIPESVFAATLEATARSLKAHGFTLICFLGDSGGNQAAQEQVAQALSAEWAASGVRVLHVGDYYARNGQSEWLEEQGERPAAIGTHAGIRDTSEVLAVYPPGVRKGRMLPDGGGPGSGCVGDPRRASRQRGEVMLELKVEAALAQIRAARASGT